jgi:hypothetical protein
MTALDFPNSPSNGDIYDDFIYDATKGVWRSLASLGGALGDLTDVDTTPPLVDGDIIAYNSDTTGWDNRFNVYDKIKYNENSPFTSSYTLTSGYNGLTVGPVTINSSVTVTVPSGTVWAIL